MNPDVAFDTDRNILRRSPGGKLEMVKLSQLLLIARAARRRRSPISGPLRAAATFVRQKVSRASNGQIEIPVPGRIARRLRSHR
ncbi:MAG: hypothetical protein ABFE13_07530 [Phycisphaerales bacterium]